MYPTREELKRKLWNDLERATGPLSGRKMSQINQLKPEDIKSWMELNEKILDNEMERLRLIHQIEAIQHRTNLLGAGWWADVIARYQLPYGRNYHISTDGTVYLLD